MPQSTILSAQRGRSSSNITFTEHPIHSDYGYAASVYAIDVDGDTDIDILGAARDADDITWWENDGEEGFVEHTIDGNFDGARSVYATDLDGDGDADVLGAATEVDVIAWWENDGTPADGGWTTHTIDNSFDYAVAVYAADVDGDEDMDVLGASYYDSQITWWENDGTPADGGWTKRNIATAFDNAVSIYATDVDGDEDVDVLGAAASGDDITWWENDSTPADGGWTEHTIDGSFDFARCVYATDIDGDDDVDVLGAAVHADDITWWENDGTPADGG